MMEPPAVESSSSASLSATSESELDAAKAITSLSSFTDRNKPKDGSSQKSASVKRRWTPEDEARLVELKKRQDLSNEDIAKELKRTTASVANKMKELKHSSSRTDVGDHGASAKRTIVGDIASNTSEYEEEEANSDAKKARRSKLEAAASSSSVTSVLMSTSEGQVYTEISSLPDMAHSSAVPTAATEAQVSPEIITAALLDSSAVDTIIHSAAIDLSAVGDESPVSPEMINAAGTVNLSAALANTQAQVTVEAVDSAAIAESSSSMPRTTLTPETVVPSSSSSAAVKGLSGDHLASTFETRTAGDGVPSRSSIVYDGNLAYIQSFIDRSENVIDLDKFRSTVEQRLELARKLEKQLSRQMETQQELGPEAPVVLALREKVELQQACCRSWEKLIEFLNVDQHERVSRSD